MAYCTNTDVKNYLGVSGTADDTLLTALIARAQAWIDAYTGRTFEASQDAARYVDVSRWTDKRALILPDDLCAITSVATNADNGSGGTTLTVNTHYVTEPRYKTPYFALVMLSSSAYSWTYTNNAEQGVLITGKWAYSATVPADIAHACIRLAAYLYRQKDASTFDVTAMPDAGVMMIPQGLPKDVKNILDLYRKVDI